jgi:hypothetical protein
MKKSKNLQIIYTRRVLLGNDSNINSGIDKETIVKKKFNQFATYIKNGVKYTIFENKIEYKDELSKDNFNYVLIAKKNQRLGSKNYYLNSIKKYDLIQEVENCVKIAEYQEKNIDKKFLEIFLKKFIDRIEKPETKFFEYAKKTFGVRYDN